MANVFALNKQQLNRLHINICKILLLANIKLLNYNFGYTEYWRFEKYYNYSSINWNFQHLNFVITCRYFVSIKVFHLTSKSLNNFWTNKLLRIVFYILFVYTKHIHNKKYNPILEGINFKTVNIKYINNTFKLNKILP